MKSDANRPSNNFGSAMWNFLHKEFANSYKLMQATFAFAFFVGHNLISLFNSYIPCIRCYNTLSILGGHIYLTITADYHTDATI